MRERGGNRYCNSSALSSKKSRGSPSPRSDAPPGQPQHGPFRSFPSKEFSCIVAGKLAYIERRKPMSALSRISVGLQAIVLALAFIDNGCHHITLLRAVRDRFAHQFIGKRCRQFLHSV